MPTYRCNHCKGLYVDPQNGVSFPHACPPPVDPKTGEHGPPDPGARDESVVVDGIPGKLPDGTPAEAAAQIKPRIKGRGAGRVMLDPGDILSGADLATIKDLQVRPGAAVPDP